MCVGSEREDRPRVFYLSLSPVLSLSLRGRLVDGHHQNVKGEKEENDDDDLSMVFSLPLVVLVYAA